MAKKDVKYSDTGLACLKALQLNADITLSELSKITGINTNSLKYWKKKAINDGVIYKRRLVNRHHFRNLLFTLIININYKDLASRIKFERAIIRVKEVRFFVRLGGGSQYFLFITTPYPIDELIYSINNIENIDLLEKSISIISGQTLYRRDYLADINLEDSPNSIRIDEEVDKSYSLDSLDEEILTSLEDNINYSLNQLSENIAVPYNTLKSRINKLKISGYLKGTVYGIHVNKLGILQTRIFITLSRINLDIINKINNFCLNNKNIIFCNRTIGEWDFSLIHEHRNPSELRDTIDEISFTFSDILRKVTFFDQEEYLKP